MPTASVGLGVDIDFVSDQARRMTNTLAGGVGSAVTLRPILANSQRVLAGVYLVYLFNTMALLDMNGGNETTRQLGRVWQWGLRQRRCNTEQRGQAHCWGRVRQRGNREVGQV